MRLSPEKNANKEEGFILNMGSIIHGASSWLKKKKMSRAPAFISLWFLTADLTVPLPTVHSTSGPGRLYPSLNCKSKQTPSSLRCFLSGCGNEKGNSLTGYAPWDPSLNMLRPASSSLEGPMVHRSKTVHSHRCSEKLSTDSISEKNLSSLHCFSLLFLPSGSCHPGALCHFPNAASSLMMVPLSSNLADSFHLGKQPALLLS